MSVQGQLFEAGGQVWQPQFPTGYADVLERIAAIKPVEYGRTRNFINGAVTRLSPYLSRGVISTRQVLQAALEKGLLPGQMEKFIQELAWREYYQRVWQHFGEHIMQDLRQPQPDVAHYEMPESVLLGTTGIESVDRAIAGLEASGYMHNHLRMYVASLSCNVGRSHWSMPAKWLYYHLLDGDVASNACSWQWVAGSFSSKKYWCNQENINKYTYSRQTGSFLDCDYATLERRDVPEVLRQTVRFEQPAALPATPVPEIDPTKPVFLYNSYNLNPEWRRQEAATRILLLEPSHFNKYPVSQRVMEFILSIAANIPGIQLYTGELARLSLLIGEQAVLSKEHPAFTHYPGQKDEREWMFPQVTGYFPSFFGFWNQCTKWIKKL